jgi:hypothetical protein
MAASLTLALLSLFTATAALTVPQQPARTSSRDPPLGRRALLLAPALVLALPKAATASYAMQAAAAANQSWKATPKSAEQAAYEDIEKKLDSKRRFRPEEGTLGYVGGEYTKQSMVERQEWEQEQQKKSSGYLKPEDLQLR